MSQVLGLRPDVFSCELKIYGVFAYCFPFLFDFLERLCPPDAEALSWLGGLGADSWALMLGGGVFLLDLGAQLLVYPN